MIIPPVIAHAIVAVCRRLAEREYVASTDGNVSVRLGDDRYACTPTMRPKGELTERDLVIVDGAGATTGGSGKASSEFRMHRLFYDLRSDVRAVVHAHPVYATGFAAAGQDLSGCVLPEVIVTLGAVPLARYATPSTDEVPQSLLPFVKTHDAVLLQNHGVVTAGKDVWDAYYKMERVEHAARILFVARLLGGEGRLDEERIRSLTAAAREHYGIDMSTRPRCETGDPTGADNCSSKKTELTTGSVSEFSETPSASEDSIAALIRDALRELGLKSGS